MAASSVWDFRFLGPNYGWSFELRMLGIPSCLGASFHADRFQETPYQSGNIFFLEIIHNKAFESC